MWGAPRRPWPPAPGESDDQQPPSFPLPPSGHTWAGHAALTAAPGRGGAPPWDQQSQGMCSTGQTTKSQPHSLHKQGCGAPPAGRRTVAAADKASLVSSCPRSPAAPLLFMSPQVFLLSTSKVVHTVTGPSRSSLELDFFHWERRFLGFFPLPTRCPSQEQSTRSQRAGAGAHGLGEGFRPRFSTAQWPWASVSHTCMTEMTPVSAWPNIQDYCKQRRLCV